MDTSPLNSIHTVTGKLVPMGSAGGWTSGLSALLSRRATENRVQYATQQHGEKNLGETLQKYPREMFPLETSLVNLPFTAVINRCICT